MDKNIKKDVEGQSEDALQQKCYFWFWNEFPFLRGLLFAVPNGAFTTELEGKRLKSTGLVSGVSDMIFLFKTRAYFIEMKVKNRKQTKEQIAWQDKVEGQGFNYFVVRSLSDFKRLMLQLIY